MWSTRRRWNRSDQPEPPAGMPVNMLGEPSNPYATIAGFPLVSVKKALTWVGVLDDRDDVRDVAQCLHCGRKQATRVLDALEQHGLVTKTAGRNQWEKTDTGYYLAFHWRPPRKLRPAIECEFGSGLDEVFETVHCSILRASPDEGEAFEDADVQVGLTTAWETDRLIALTVMQPDDYDDPDSSATEALATYISCADALRLVAGLQKAAAIASKEIARRSARSARRAKRDAKVGAGESASYRAQGARPPAESCPSRGVEASPPSPCSTRSGNAKPNGKAEGRAAQVAPSPVPGSTHDAKSHRRTRAALTAALKELRATNKARLPATEKPPKE